MRIPRTKKNVNSNELRMLRMVIEVAIRKNGMTWTDERSSTKESNSKESSNMFVSFHCLPLKPHLALKEPTGTDKLRLSLTFERKEVLLESSSSKERRWKRVFNEFMTD